MKFDKEYTDYWSSTVNKSVDGTVIAGAKEVLHIIEYLQLKKTDNGLDLGCSFGRLQEVLSTCCDTVYGVDVDQYAVEKARLQAYEEVKIGGAEQTGFDANFFDLVFCWAVFEVVDHKKGLAEINRVLKTGGKVIITGKNNNYHIDDTLAYRAEKNAFLKGFPNRFTNLNAVLDNLTGFGLKLDKLLIFPRRGDMGLVEFIDHGVEKKTQYPGCEYLIMCSKVSDHDASSLLNVTLENPFSKTASMLAAQAGYERVDQFFKVIGLD